MTDQTTFILILIFLLTISILNNVLMYYKCYINNQSDDPFIPDSIGSYQINVYYNKLRYPAQGIDQKIKQYIDPFKENTYGEYVVTYKKPTPQEYQQISKLSHNI